jgi:transposase
LHADLPAALQRAGEFDLDTVIIDGVTVRAFGGGEATGPSPVDRRRPGTKHRHGRQGGHPVGDPHGRGQRHRQILPVTLDFPRVGCTPGRPKELPDEAYADRGYDSESLRALLRRPGIEPRIARRKTAHGSGLGKVRRVVERTISWLKGLRRLLVRCDRLGVIMDAWATLAVSVACFRILHHDAVKKPGFCQSRLAHSEIGNRDLRPRRARDRFANQPSPSEGNPATEGLNGVNVLEQIV